MKGDRIMKKTALVVDDTPYIREDIKEILIDQGYEVYEAGDGLEAIEMYKKSQEGYDFVFLTPKKSRKSSKIFYSKKAQFISTGF